MDLDIAASPDYHISIYFLDAVPLFSNIPNFIEKDEKLWQKNNAQVDLERGS